MPPSAASRSRLGLDVVPNAFKPTSEPSCSAAVPQFLGRRARVFIGLNIMNRIVILPFLVQLEQGFRTVPTGSTQALLTRRTAVARLTASEPLLGKHLLFAGNALSYPF